LIKIRAILSSAGGKCRYRFADHRHREMCRREHLRSFINIANNKGALNPAVLLQRWASPPVRVARSPNALRAICQIGSDHSRRGSDSWKAGKFAQQQTVID